MLNMRRRKFITPIHIAQMFWRMRLEANSKPEELLNHNGGFTPAFLKSGVAAACLEIKIE